MKKRMMRLGALGLIVSLTAGLNITAFADDRIGANGIAETTENTILIEKGITVEGSLSRVYGPEITYSYTAAPAAAPTGADVTDADGITSVVTAGPEGGLVLADNGQVEFNSAEVNTNEELTGTLAAQVDMTKFSKPGVYRYEITDVTTADTLNEAGISRAEGYDTTRYLDVYIRYNNAELETYGYVLTADNTTNITANTGKSAGFISDSEGEGTRTDRYTTVDVTVTKKVTGSMGDIHHEFPFSITVDNNGLYYYGNKGTAATIENDMNETAFETALAHETTYYLTGLNPNATVIYEETNDTADTYTLTVKNADGTELQNTAIGAGEAKNTGEAALEVKDEANRAVEFINNLDEISPTGVIMRIAPYLLILAAGIVLIVIRGRRRREAD